MVKFWLCGRAAAVRVCSRNPLLTKGLDHGLSETLLRVRRQQYTAPYRELQQLHFSITNADPYSSSRLTGPAQALQVVIAGVNVVTLHPGALVGQRF